MPVDYARDDHPVVSRAVQQLLEANERFAARWDQSHLSPEPELSVVVVTCMDARLQPSDFLDLTPGDAHILRTAGAQVTSDVIRSLIVSTTLLGTRSVILVHHTDCGLATHDQGEMVCEVGRATGHDPVDIDFHVIGDAAAALREDVARIQACEYLPDDLEIVAGTYDVTTGRLAVEIVTERHAPAPAPAPSRAPS